MVSQKELDAQAEKRIFEKYHPHEAALLDALKTLEKATYAKKREIRSIEQEIKLLQTKLELNRDILEETRNTYDKLAKEYGKARREWYSKGEEEKTEWYRSKKKRRDGA